MLITSLDNKKIKLINSLKNKKNRKELGLFIVEGMHLVKEAYESNCLEEIFLLDNYQLEFNYDKEINYVTKNVLNKITDLENTVVIGICKMNNSNTIKGNHILMLDGIQDPGNLGTIIRSSLAFNVDTIILSNETVDLYNDKVLRSTQGMIFNINILRGDLKEYINELKQNNYLILGTDVNNGTNVKDIKIDKYCLIMGNEGNGVSSEIKELCDKNLYINMNDKCESLNVGVATSILLYELGYKNE